MIIQLLINGTDYTSAIQYPLQMSDIIDGGQDSGGIVLYTTTKTPFSQYSKVDIAIGANHYYWYTGDDKVTRKTGASPYFMHNITLVEPIRLTEGYYLSNLTFTQPLQRELAISGDIYTYASALARVLAVTPLKLFYDTVDFGIDSATYAKLDKIEYPESFPTGKNLYEFLLNIGRALGAVPYIVDWDTIKYFWIDDVNNEISPSEPIYANLFLEKSIDQYCTNIDTTLNNVVAENDEEQGSIVVPAPSGYTSARNPNATRYDGYDPASIIELPHPVHKLINVIWRGWCTTYDVSEEGITDFISVDITNRIIEKTQYEILPDVEKSKHLYYEYGKSYIGGLFYQYEQMFGFNSDYGICFTVKAAYEDVHGANTFTYINKTNAKDYLYRIEYIPIVKTLRCQIERKSDPSFRAKFSFAANQTDASVSSKSIGNLYQQHIERIGKESRKYVWNITDYLADVPQVGGYFVDNGEKFYLYKLNCLIESPNKGTLETFWSKDYTAISEMIGLNAMPRFSEIALNTVNRSDVFREFCVISNTYSASVSEFYTEHGSEAAMRASIWAPPVTAMISTPIQCNFVYARTTNDPPNYIQGAGKALLMPVSSVAIGNSLSLSIAFKDNFSAGTQIKAYGDNAFIPYDVRYTHINSLGGSFGRVSYLTLDFVTDVESGKIDDIAECKLLPEISVSNFATNRLFQLPYIAYYKDGREVPSINYQMCFESSGTLVLGEAFTQRNPLIATNKNTYVLYSSLTRVSYNTTMHEWVEDANGAYVKYGDRVLKDTVIRRYNAYLSGWIQNDSGTHFLFSKDGLLVYKLDYINPNEKGPVEFDAIAAVAINTLSPLSADSYIPVWWFGSVYGAPPAFNTTYKSWALIDEYGTLILGNNAQNFNNIYFNFTREKTYANNI